MINREVENKKQERRQVLFPNYGKQQPDGFMWTLKADYYEEISNYNMYNYKGIPVLIAEELKPYQRLRVDDVKSIIDDIAIKVEEYNPQLLALINRVTLLDHHGNQIKQKLINFDKANLDILSNSFMIATKSKILKKTKEQVFEYFYQRLCGYLVATVDGKNPGIGEFVDDQRCTDFRIKYIEISKLENKRNEISRLNLKQIEEISNDCMKCIKMLFENTKIDGYEKRINFIKQELKKDMQEPSFSVYINRKIEMFWTHEDIKKKEVVNRNLTKQSMCAFNEARQRYLDECKYENSTPNQNMPYNIPKGFFVSTNDNNYQIGHTDMDGKSYDRNNRQIGHTDMDGKVYDSNNRQIGHVDRDGKIYDSNNRQTGHVDKDGNIYDSNNRRIGRR